MCDITKAYIFMVSVTLCSINHASYIDAMSKILAKMQPRAHFIEQAMGTFPWWQEEEQQVLYLHPPPTQLLITTGCHLQITTGCHRKNNIPSSHTDGTYIHTKSTENKSTLICFTAGLTACDTKPLKPCISMNTSVPLLKKNRSDDAKSPRDMSQEQRSPSRTALANPTTNQLTNSVSTNP
jgi:hypothetical protein